MLLPMNAVTRMAQINYILSTGFFSISMINAYLPGTEASGHCL